MKAAVPTKTMTIINRCKKLHKLAFQKLECEVIIWD